MHTTYTHLCRSPFQLKRQTISIYGFESSVCWVDYCGYAVSGLFKTRSFAKPIPFFFAFRVPCDAFKMRTGVFLFLYACVYGIFITILTVCVHFNCIQFYSRRIVAIDIRFIVRCASNVQISVFNCFALINQMQKVATIEIREYCMDVVIVCCKSNHIDWTIPNPIWIPLWMFWKSRFWWFN